MNVLELKALNQAFIEMCRDARSLSANTIAAYRHDLADFEAFYAGTGRAHPDVTCLQSYIQHLRSEKKRSAATVRRRIACLKSLFRWARDAGTLPASPFDSTSITIRIPRRLPRSLSRTQIGSLMQSARPVPIHAPLSDRDLLDSGYTTYLAICLMLTTGIRVGELTAIALPDLDPGLASISIKGKGSRHRMVYVTNDAFRAHLRAYYEARRHALFPDNLLLRNSFGRPLTPQTLRTRLRHIAGELDFDQPLTPHRFRHTAATVLLEEGVDIRYVQRLLGHSTISTTEIYTRVSDTRLRAAVERADVFGKVA